LNTVLYYTPGEDKAGFEFEFYIDINVVEK
jgi:hypothetical protein